MFWIGIYYLILSCESVSVSGTKSWIPNTNMNDKSNWNIFDLPRTCDDLSLNVNCDLTLFWSIGDLLVSGLSLPVSGTLLFRESVSIAFQDQKKCPEARHITYKRDDWRGWLDPKNWHYTSEWMWLPHSERIPCFGEDINFPAGNTFAAELPTVRVPIGKIFIDNEVLDGEDWADFLNTDLGKSQFRSDVIIQYPWLYDVGCTGERKCSCGKSAYVLENRINKFVDNSELHRAICSYAESSCRAVSCYSSVIPEGHCCGLCGAVIKIKDNSKDDSLLNQLMGKVKDLKMESSHDVMFHVGRTIDDNIEVAIVTHESNYLGETLAAGTLIYDYLIENEYEIISTKFSHLTLSAYLFNNASGIVFGTLFAAILFFASLYLFYVVLPEKNIRREQPFGFARFRNILNESVSEENLEIGTEPELATDDSAGFNNPTFSNDDRAGPSNLEIQGECVKELELTDRQEYDNPTYHEMEKTRDLSFLDKEVKEEDNDDVQQFTEVEL